MYALRLNQYAHGDRDFYTGGDVLNALVHFRISGLDWINSSYDARTNQVESYATLMTREILEAVEAHDLSPNIGVLYFKASTIEKVNIVIELIRASDNLPAEYHATTYFPPSIYNLSITPI